MTHSDVLHFLNTTNFGTWAIILYIGAAITGLLGVATNAPMKNYTWFFIGPALYSFLVGTTMEVQGVNWVVANKAQENMAEVWKNAETGLANTKLARDPKRGVTINGKDGPSGQYEVAMPMVFLDELFSATANILIEWTGIGTQVAGKGNGTNLANNQSQPEGPWWLLSTLKWGYIENIVSATARDPDVRDALVTFLGSECGAKFKEGINSGAYIAAAQARGATPVTSVMIEEGQNNYQKFIEILSNEAIPAPRSLANLFKGRTNLQVGNNDDPNSVGPPPLPGLLDKNQGNYVAPTFLNFSQKLLRAIPTGRGHGIVCSEYLWTLIQAFRYEAGHAYYQLTRSSPNGLTEQQFVNTLLYGWDIRKQPDSAIAKADEQEAFIKHLILAYIVRNELLFAPQITSVDQRFAPSEQAKSYSDAYVRSYGSKAKFIELYNAAIMMPYLQGILAYFLIVAYPIACMLVILPGHYKGFFTWVSFFAWIKIWDVGFAMVQVIERSVWAMVGNNGHMAATANVLIETAEKVGGIGVTNPVGPGMGKGYGVLKPGVLAAQGALPLVCSVSGMNGECATNMAGEYQSLPKAIELFDKLLLTSANIDLDLSNGWYIYIMSALYLAVPAVTGQLVLGAKAGSASMMKDAWSGVASDGSTAAKTGAQHGAVAALQTNQKSLGQAARAKALGKADGSGRSLAAQSMDLGNQASELGVESARLAGKKDFLQSKAGMARNNLDSFGRGGQLFGAAYGGLDSTLGEKYFPKTQVGGDEAVGPNGEITQGGRIRNGLSAAGGVGLNAGMVQLGRRMDGMALDSAARGQDLSWKRSANDLQQGALKDQSGKMSSLAEFEADSAAWEAKNEFAAHASAIGGIAGMNAGNLAPGEKPLDTNQLAVSGNLDGFSSVTGADGRRTAVNNGNNASSAAWYSKETLPTSISTMRDNGIKQHGGAAIRSSWAEGGGSYSALGAAGKAFSATKTTENWVNANDTKKLSDGAAAVSQYAKDVATGIPDIGVAKKAVEEWAGRADFKKD
jgi:hypothetical protein